jgi:hypothetical protein
MQRRQLLEGLLAGLVLLAPTSVEARCAPPQLPNEVRASRYVFEGVIESVTATEATLRVVAAWKGTPPAQLRVAVNPRVSLARATPGQTFLVLAQGDSDATLTVARCGATGMMSAALATRLGALHLQRRVAPSQ